MFKPITILSHQARLSWLFSRIGRPLETVLLNVVLMGHRVLVVDEPPETKYKGLIEIPHTSQERGAAGFILGVGMGVGLGNLLGGSYEPWFSESAAPTLQPELLGRHIAYRYTAGFSIQTSSADDGYSGDIKVMHAKDIILFHYDEGEDFPPISKETK